MTRVDCAGGQDRQTKTSETHPNRPPSQTRNCYLTGNNGFDWSQCGTSGDNACTGRGDQVACKPDNQGGYCETGGQYFISGGSSFIPLSASALMNRYGSTDSSNSNETGREVNRALNDQERKFTNRIRELQIMGKNPLVKRDSKKGSTNEVHGFIGDMLFNIGIGASVIIFLISICIILIQNKII